MYNIFNNREIASVVWLLLFSVWAISKPGVREAFRNVIRSFLKWQILLPLLAMMVYLAIVIKGLNVIGFWDVTISKDTILWILGFALIMLFHANDVDKREGFFRNSLLNNLKLIAILEFVSNAYTFSLWIELLLVPSLTLIALLKTVAEFELKTKPGYRIVDNLLGYILAITGIVLIGIAVYKAINDVNGFVTILNLRNFLLPLVLSGLYLPFLYLWALFLVYERIFVRIDIFNNDERLAGHLKKLVLFTFNVKLWRLLQWTRRTPSLHVSNRQDAAILVKSAAND